MKKIIAAIAFTVLAATASVAAASTVNTVEQPGCCGDTTTTAGRDADYTPSVDVSPAAVTVTPAFTG